MSVKRLTEHHLEYLSLKGGCTGSSESTLVKIPHSWKLHVTAHLLLCITVCTTFWLTNKKTYSEILALTGGLNFGFQNEARKHWCCIVVIIRT